MNSFESRLIDYDEWVSLRSTHFSSPLIRQFERDSIFCEFPGNILTRALYNVVLERVVIQRTIYHLTSRYRLTKRKWINRKGWLREERRRGEERRAAVSSVFSFGRIILQLILATRRGEQEGTSPSCNGIVSFNRLTAIRSHSLRLVACSSLFLPLSSFLLRGSSLFLEFCELFLQNNSLNDMLSNAQTSIINSGH